MGLIHWKYQFLQIGFLDDIDRRSRPVQWPALTAVNARPHSGGGDSISDENIKKNQ